MTDTEKDKVWVHVLMEKDLAKDLDNMVADDDSDRSKFVRKLIREEKSRRQQFPLPFPKEPRHRKTDRHSAQAAAA